MQNIVFAGREACVANITFEGDFTAKEEILAKIKSHEYIIDASL